MGVGLKLWGVDFRESRLAEVQLPKILRHQGLCAPS
jgi:hypothetical protein